MSDAKKLAIAITALTVALIATEAMFYVNGWYNASVFVGTVSGGSFVLAGLSWAEAECRLFGKRDKS